MMKRMNYFAQSKLELRAFSVVTTTSAIAQQNHSITFDVEFGEKKKKVLSLFIFFTFAVMADCQDRTIKYAWVHGLVLVRSKLNPPTLYSQPGV